MLEQKDVDFLLDLYSYSNKSTNIFQYVFDLRKAIQDYVGAGSNFFIYSNGSWFNEQKQPIEINHLCSYGSYTDGVQVVDNQHIAFFIESYMSKIVIYCDTGRLDDSKLQNIRFGFTLIRNTLEKISREQLASNFKHQIEHLKTKLHETQLDRQQAIADVYQTAVNLKNPLTSIKGYAEIIKASIPTTNEVLRSVHHYSDLVLNNTTNIVNKINLVLKLDEANLNEEKLNPNIDKFYKYENVTAVIADSWTDNATLIKILLGTAGINCFSASSQEEIISLARTHNPEIILIDEKIDHGKGIQTALLLRELNINSTCIALTAAFKENNRKLYLQSGFNEVLTKPIDRTKLLTIIDRYFSNRNIYASKNMEEIEKAERLAHNHIHENAESTVASNIFLKNINFNITALSKALETNDLLTIKKIVNIIRRTSGSIGLLDMSSYADMVYKAIENQNHKAIRYNLNMLITEMKNVVLNKETKQISY